MLTYNDSEFIHIRETAGSTDLVFVFSHIDTQKGAFSFWKVASALPANLVFVNAGSNNWYHNGIQGLSSNISETVAVLADIAAKLGCANIYTFGASMGGYAAALFGSFLNAKRCLMIATETVLLLPGSRSERFVKTSLDRDYMDINSLVRCSQGTEFIAWVGNEEPVDLVCLDRLVPAANVSPHVVPGCGHFAAKRMHDDCLLIPALQGLVSGKTNSKLSEYHGFNPAINIRDLYMFLRQYVIASETAVEDRYRHVTQAIESVYPSAVDRVSFHLALGRTFHHRQNFIASAVANTAAVFADQTRWDSFLALSVALANQGKTIKAERALKHARERGYR